VAALLKRVSRGLSSPASITNKLSRFEARASPEVLGLIGQTQVFLNLTDGTGPMVWQVYLGVNPANANLTAMQNSTLNVVLQQNLIFSEQRCRSWRKIVGC
jgi:hypothetical protein